MKKWIVLIVAFIVIYPLAFMGYFLYGDRWGLQSTIDKIPVFNTENKYDTQNYVNYDRWGGEVDSAYNRTVDPTQLITLYDNYLSVNGWSFVSNSSDESWTHIYYSKNFQ